MPKVIKYLNDGIRLVEMQRKTKCSKCGKAIKKGEKAIQQMVVYSEYWHMYGGGYGWRTYCVECFNQNG